jgi:hypothetical protein
MNMVLWTFAEQILVAMLALATPGASPYSALPLDPAAGVVCDTEWTEGCRRETEAEALERWRVIAQATAEVSGGDVELAARLVTVAFFESQFRRDVHAGVGEWARGDQGMSYSLGQLLLGGGQTTRGWFGRDLVGVDLEATRRALAATGCGLLRCRGSFRCYGGVPEGRRSKAIEARETTYRRVRALLNINHQENHGTQEASPVDREPAAVLQLLAPPGEAPRGERAVLSPGSPHGG